MIILPFCRFATPPDRGHCGAWLMGALFLLSAGLFSSGCASPAATRAAEATQQRVKLIRTQAGDRVTLQWESEPNLFYSVVYTTSLAERRPWQQMPQYTNLPGTGGTMTVVFTSPEPGSLYYRLVENNRPSR